MTQIQLPPLPLQRPPSPGQRPGVGRRGGPRPRPSRSSCEPKTMPTSLTITDPKGKTSDADPRQDRRRGRSCSTTRTSTGDLPREVGARTAPSRSPSTSSTTARATSPLGGSFPEGTPREPGRRLQDQDRLQPGRRDPAGPSWPLASGGKSWPSIALGASSASSGTSTTAGSISDPRPAGNFARVAS